MSERIKGLSKGYRKHVRNVLAETRRDGNSKSVERVEADVSRTRLASSVYRRGRERLGQIDQILLATSVDPQTTATLRIEKIWLHFHLGDTNPKDRIEAQETLMNDLEQTSPDLYNWLLEEVEDARGDSVTRLFKIRDQVSKTYL